jgi:hypothetical protein
MPGDSGRAGCSRNSRAEALMRPVKAHPQVYMYMEGLTVKCISCKPVDLCCPPAPPR